MGQNAGKLAKRGYEYISGKSGSSGDASSSASTSQGLETSGFRAVATRYVLTRTSSLYFDEDGDLANEFYQEASCKNSKRKYILKRIKHGLTPQGEVKLKIPRLHSESRMVMRDAVMCAV